MERAQIHFFSDVSLPSCKLPNDYSSSQNLSKRWRIFLGMNCQVLQSSLKRWKKIRLICLRPALTPHQEFHIVAQRRTVKECTKKCDSRAELLVVYHLQKVPGKSSRKVNRTLFFCSLPGATERLKRTSWPGLLEAWLELTSVKYHGNLYILIPLTIDQR